MIPAMSKLERATASLVIIDVQERLAAAMPSRERVLSRAGLTVRAAGIVDMPVLVTRQYPQGLGDTEPTLVSMIGERQSPDPAAWTVDKVAFDCFEEPSFVEVLCASSRRQLVLAGMETHICVTQTALSALREGFDVHVVADACCSRDDSCHEYALRRLVAAGAVITTAESVAYELVGRAGTPEFKMLLEAVKG